MTATPETESVVRPVPGRSPNPGPHRSSRRSWPYLLAAFLVLAVLGGGGFVVYRTPLVGVQQVEVVTASGELGADVVDAVKSAADIPEGAPLMGIDLVAVRRNALTVPQIASAAVSRRWPHELLITVTQRTPMAVTSANGAMWLLDATGLPYLKVDRSAVPGRLLTVALATPGPHDAPTLAALAVIGELAAPIRVMVSSVRARSPYDVELDLLDGRTVIWGSPDKGAQKIQILPAVLAQPGKTYDISDPDYVTVRS